MARGLHVFEIEKSAASLAVNVVAVAMWLFDVLVSGSLYAFLALLALSIACGLYYVAELAEEYPQVTKTILRYTIVVVLILHVLLYWFEGLGAFPVFFGIFSHIIYSGLLKQFPFVDVRRPTLWISVACFAVSHFVWYNFFMDPTNLYYPFREVITFFSLCVWLVPFGYFASLTFPEGDQLPLASQHAAGSSKKSDDFAGPSAMEDSYSTRERKRRQQFAPWLLNKIKTFGAVVVCRWFRLESLWRYLFRRELQVDKKRNV